MSSHSGPLFAKMTAVQLLDYSYPSYEIRTKISNNEWKDITIDWLQQLADKWEAEMDEQRIGVRNETN